MAVSYTRESPEWPSPELAEQNAAILEWAEGTAFRMTKGFKDVTCGCSIAGRPGLTKLLREASRKARKWTTVIVTDPMRLSSNRDEQALILSWFKVKGVKVLFVYEC